MSGILDFLFAVGIYGLMIYLIVMVAKAFGTRRSEKKQRVGGQADYDKSVQAWKTSRDE